MEKLIKLKKNNSESYDFIQCDDIALSILVCFLIDEVFPGRYYNFYTNWLKGQITGESISGNSPYGLLEHQNRIYVYDYTEPDKDLAYFNTTREDMLEIIDRWINVARTIYTSEDNKKIELPDEIIITQDNNGKVTIKRGDGFEPNEYQTEPIKKK